MKWKRSATVEQRRRTWSARGECLGSVGIDCEQHRDVSLRLGGYLDGAETYGAQRRLQIGHEISEWHNGQQEDLDVRDCAQYSNRFMPVNAVIELMVAKRNSEVPIRPAAKAIAHLRPSLGISISYMSASEEVSVGAGANDLRKTYESAEDGGRDTGEVNDHVAAISRVSATDAA